MEIVIAVLGVAAILGGLFGWVVTRAIFDHWDRMEEK
jgi:hypothetical protein